ncbi:MAG: hypothetical protein GXO26_03775 [Crenarchaeota archaeon]|nr:hypothetical protein [Thermoproteota archaeon]
METTKIDKIEKVVHARSRMDAVLKFLSCLYNTPKYLIYDTFEIKRLSYNMFAVINVKTKKSMKVKVEEVSDLLHKHFLNDRAFRIAVTE